MRIPSYIPPLISKRKPVVDITQHPLKQAREDHEGTSDLAIHQKRLLDITGAINGNLEFGNPADGPVNIKGVWANDVTPGIADTEFTITHNLGYIPTGFLVASVDKASILYSSRKNLWTAQQMFLKCNQATVTYSIFII